MESDSDDDAPKFKETLTCMNELKGCEMGDGLDSQTIYLQSHTTCRRVGEDVGVDNEEVIMCDTPGFGDTRSTSMDVANSMVSCSN